MKKRVVNKVPTKEQLSKIKFIILDIDGVSVPRGTKIREVSHSLKMKVREIPRREIDQIKELSKKGYYIGVNSGRGLYMLQDMFHDVLPSLIITYENGSATWHRGKIYQHANGFKKLHPIICDLRKIKHPDIKGFEPKEFIITIHCEKRIKKIENIVSKHKGVYWIWNDEAYDIGIEGKQTKSRGLREVMKIFGFNKENILFVGDNYNDISLQKEVGIVVSADKSRLKGDFYVDMNRKKFPAEQVMDWFLEK